MGNTLESQGTLSSAEQEDRATFWRYYCGGVDRLAWEAARTYRHRFEKTGNLTQALINVYDFDSCSANDILGHVRIPLRAAGLDVEVTVNLTTDDGKLVTGKDGPSTLTYSVCQKKYPEGGRLASSWQVRVLKAHSSPGCDGLG